MNEYQRLMMGSPSIDTEGCAICGRWSPTNLHHIVPRGQGGTGGPVIRLCGFGSNLRDADGREYCHGLAHHNRLHFKWEGGHWWYIALPEPTKYHVALKMDGWRRLRA